MDKTSIKIGTAFILVAAIFASLIVGASHASAAERFYFRSTLAAFKLPAPVTQKVIYEKKCSFNVIKLEPGTYRTVATNTIEAVGHLWDALPTNQLNLWFYSHVSGNCVAAGGSLGYRYAWTTMTESKFKSALAASGLAEGRFENGRLYFDVTAPMWLAGEVAQGIAMEKVF